MVDPYQVLGVSSSASDDEIRERYRVLLKQYNADLSSPSPACDVAKNKIVELNEAYDEIMNLRRGGGYQSSQFSDIRRFIAQNRISEADELLEGVPAISRNAEWHFLKGSVLHSKGWLDMAAKHFSEAVRLNPDNAEYRAAFNNITYQRNTGYNQNGGQPYRTTQLQGCSGCDICSSLICADCCCECMGGDFISCC